MIFQIIGKIKRFLNLLHNYKLLFTELSPRHANIFEKFSKQLPSKFETTLEHLPVHTLAPALGLAQRALAELESIRFCSISVRRRGNSQEKALPQKQGFAVANC